MFGLGAVAVPDEAGGGRVMVRVRLEGKSAIEGFLVGMMAELKL